MKRSSLSFFLILIVCQIATCSFAKADGVSDACDFVSRQVSTFKGALVRQAPDTFEDEGKIYRGCLLTESPRGTLLRN